MYKILLLTLTVILIVLPAAAQVQINAPAGDADIAAWIEARFSRGKTPPFSFVYGGKHSSEFIRNWKFTARDGESGDDNVFSRIFTYTDPATGFGVECRVRGYKDFNAVDWVLHFTNGTSNSPQLTAVKALDMTIDYSGGKDINLYYTDGNHISKADFHPRHAVIGEQSKRIVPKNGRSSEGAFPFFNIESGGRGVVMSVGWSGTWYSEFCKRGNNGIELSAGMEYTDLYLLPGESIRTPSVGLMFWSGADRMDGHNKFRRMVLTHYNRKIDGKSAEYPLCSGFNYRDPAPCTEYSCITADWAVAMINRYGQFGLVPDVFWLDAGWNTGAADYKDGKSWANTTGNWTIDKTRFPDGLKPVADAAHDAGAKFMVWFEPERVIKGTQWTVDFPQWMLDLPSEPDGTYLLFDLGNPQALEWLCEYYGNMIEQNGIDYYRQDFNMYPDKYWEAHDEPGRRGIKEIRHIEGLYAFWDYLLERFPGMIIDNCASGGKRIDLETIPRSAPLWRSDYYHYDDPDGYQGHTYGLNFFLPVHGTGILQTDKYSFRSSISSTLIYNWKITDASVSFLDMQDRIREFRDIKPYYYEDYYPLTGVDSLTRDDRWIAYQLHRSSDETGIVMAFRRADSPDASILVGMGGVDPAKKYIVTDADGGTEEIVGGEDLRRGYALTLPEPRSSMLLKYKIAPNQ